MGFRVQLSNNKEVVMRLFTNDAVEAKSFLNVACRTMHEKLGTIESIDHDMDMICVESWDPRKAAINIKQNNFVLDGRKA